MKIVPLLCLMCVVAGSTFSQGVTMRTDVTSAASTTSTVGKSVTETTQGTLAAASTSVKRVTEKAEETSTSAAGTSNKGIVEKTEASSNIPASLAAKRRRVPGGRRVLGGSGLTGNLALMSMMVPVTVKPVESSKTTTRKRMTACERLRNTALQATSAFKPECDLDGSFKKRQCMVDVAMKEENCWCVDPRGIEVTGTRKKSRMKPDCNFGENLSTCVFQLVQHSQGMLGEYKPKCTLKGEYEPIQCQGSECWCVDGIGDVISSTIVNRPNIPKCPSGLH